MKAPPKSLSYNQTYQHRLNPYPCWRSAKAAGSVNVVQTGINTPKPSRSTPNHAGTYGVDVAKTSSISTTSSSGLITTAGRPTENWGWQNIEDMQRDTMMRGLEQTINANRQSFSGMPQNPINYQSLWGEGARPGVQLPPITVNGIELNHAATKPPQHKHLQMAGFVPDGGYQRTLEISAKALQSIFAAFLPDMSDHPGAENPMDHIKRIITPESVDNFAKSVPKGAIMPLKGICTLMLPDMSGIPGAEDPKTHFKRFSHNALLKYDNIMQIDPHAFSAKAGEFVGEMFAFGALGKVIRVAEGISVLGMACEGGMVGLVVSEAHDTNKVAGVAFGFIGGAAFARLSSRSQNPLADRVLTRPQELRLVRSINTPVYRSGFVSNKTVARLAKRNVRTILPIEKGGRRVGEFQYSDGSFNHFDEIISKGVHKGKLERPYMRSLQTIKEVMNAKPPVADPMGVPGFLWWNVPGKFRGTEGHWELLLNPENNMICHLNFKT